MLTTIFYHVDEFCKEMKKQNQLIDFSSNKKRNRKFCLTISEVMTICIYYHYSGYKTFKDYYCRYVCVHMINEFKKLVSYNRFVELKSLVALPMMLFTKAWFLYDCTGVSVIDSSSIKVCNNKRISAHKTFKGLAQRGHTSVGWFYGFKLHIIINHVGEIIDFYITSGQVSDNNSNVLRELTKKIFGKLFGDRGYLVNQNMLQELYNRGIQLITKIRKNMKNKLMNVYDKTLLRRRGIIETVIGILKEGFGLEHSRHRSCTNFLTHICSSVAAYHFRPNKPLMMPKLQALKV